MEKEGERGRERERENGRERETKSEIKSTKKSIPKIEIAKRSLFYKMSKILECYIKCCYKIETSRCQNNP